MVTKKLAPSWSSVKARLADVQRQPLWDGLDTMRHTSHNFGYGVSDDMDDLHAEYGADD